MAHPVLRSLRQLSLTEVVAIALSAAGYVLMAYFLPRSNFLPLLAVYTCLFSIYLLFITRSGYSNKKVVLLLVLSFLFRLVFLPATPSLSDDYKRYLWDGHLIHQGINPYHFQPSEISEEIEGFNADWKTLVLSKDHYTAYPPIMQGFFFLAASFPHDQVKITALRIFILLLELGTVILLIKLLALLNLHQSYVLLYALNPLVIIELSGNLHFEGTMTFFTLLAVYYWKKGQVAGAGMSLSGAMLSRLLPLVFLPAFVKRPLQSKHILFTTVSLAIFAAGLLIIGQQGLVNMADSLRLYFQTFEFNGSIYYIIRWIGYQTHGYSIIHLAAPYLTAGMVALAAGLAIKQWTRPFSQPFAFFFLFLTGYYLLATTVNPWYITPVVAYGIFYKSATAITWSFAVFLSYHAFDGGEFHEAGWVLAAEYGLLLAAMAYDFVFSKHQRPKHEHS